MSTTTEATAAERVQAGVAYLDDVMPGWHNKIDLGKLDLASGCRCVLGQLAIDINGKVGFGANSPYSVWVAGLLPGIEGIDYEQAEEYGFNSWVGPDGHRRGMMDLKVEWRRVISERQS